MKNNEETKKLNTFESEEELYTYALTSLNKRVGDFDQNRTIRNTASKGNIGHVMEVGFFGYDINSNINPDFENLGVELKVTGYRTLKNGKISAKERLVLSMIDFHNDYKYHFYNSTVYRKINKILFMLYEYKTDVDYYDFVISNIYLYKFQEIPEKDKAIILQDFKFIMKKIMDGNAHELSESDTYYLGACPKGKNRLDTTSQPFSDIPAMRRAYSFKTSYMTYLLRSSVFVDKKQPEALIKDVDKLKEKTMDQIIEDLFNPYVGKTLSEIDILISKEIRKTKSKRFLATYVSKMLNLDQDNLEKIEEFEKSNIVIKTIRVQKNKKVKESMSFPAFDFIEVANSTWEESTHRDFFSSVKFLFVIFDEIDKKSNEYRFRGIKFWNFTDEQIETKFKQCWNKTKSILNTTLVLNIKNNRINNNFPKSSENEIFHVRPHGTNRLDTRPLPPSSTIKIASNDLSVNLDFILKKHRFTKLCFWINNTYIEKIIGN